MSRLINVDSIIALLKKSVQAVRASSPKKRNPVFKSRKQNSIIMSKLKALLSSFTSRSCYYENRFDNFNVTGSHIVEIQIRKRSKSQRIKKNTIKQCSNYDLLSRFASRVCSGRLSFPISKKRVFISVRIKKLVIMCLFQSLELLVRFF